jgi:hypothetical protein
LNELGRGEACSFEEPLKVIETEYQRLRTPSST